jgi:hypothetical protein
MRYLAAPNAEVKKGADGSVRLVQLLPLSDDRDHLGENHGRSTITTERVRNDWGELVGGDLRLKHKDTSPAWSRLAVKVSPEAHGERNSQNLKGQR